MERKAKREADRLLAAVKAKTARQEKTRQAKAAIHQQNAIFIATFAKRAKDATIAASTTTEEAEDAGHATTSEAETTFADIITMHE